MDNELEILESHEISNEDSKSIVELLETIEKEGKIKN